MPPSKKRIKHNHLYDMQKDLGNCACLGKESSNGVCEFHVFQGVSIEVSAGKVFQADRNIHIQGAKVSIIKGNSTLLYFN